MLYMILLHALLLYFDTKMIYLIELCKNNQTKWRPFDFLSVLCKCFIFIGPFSCDHHVVCGLMQLPGGRHVVTSYMYKMYHKVQSNRKYRSHTSIILLSRQSNTPILLSLFISYIITLQHKYIQTTAKK